MVESSRAVDSLYTFLASHRDQILEDWAQAVRDDPAVPEADHLSEPALKNHLPQFFDALLAHMASPSGTASQRVGQGQAADEHAHQRFEQRYSLQAALREWAHFRRVLLAAVYASGLPLPLDTLTYLNAAIDEAASRGASEMHEAAKAALAESQQALEQAVERLRAIQDTAADGILTITERGEILSANPATSKMFGYPLDELLGQNVSMLMPQPYRDEHDGYLATYLRTSVPKVIGKGREVVGVRKDGSLFPAELSVSDTRVLGGRFFTGILRDITERKKIEHEREQALAQLRQAVDFRDRFIAILGHDLRNPLNAITMGTSILLHQDIPEPVTRTLRKIAASSKRMATMIEDLLDLTRVQLGGGIPVHPRPVRLNLICERVIAELETTRPERQVLFATNHQCEGVWDPDRLEQMVSNLLVNAFDYSPADTPVHVRVEGKADRVQLDVSNQSDPIPAEVATRIFDPFKGSVDGRSKGLGLGLFIVKEIVERHGGRITLTSHDGTTSFRVVLPRAAVSPPTKPAPPAAA